MYSYAPYAPANTKYICLPNELVSNSYVYNINNFKRSTYINIISSLYIIKLSTTVQFNKANYDTTTTSDKNRELNWFLSCSHQNV